MQLGNGEFQVRELLGQPLLYRRHLLFVSRAILVSSSLMRVAKKLLVSPLCLGTMNFGPHTPKTDSLRDHGPRARRSASTSSTPPTSTAAGRGPPSRSSAAGSPRAAGAARRSCSPPRSTAPMGDWPNESRLSAAHIRSACEASPAPAPDRPHRPVPDAPRRPRRRRGTRSGRRWSCSSQQGKVIYVGSSNFAGWHIARANESGAARRHFLGLVSEQSLYNLNERTIELEVLPACEAYGVGLIPWSPLGGRPARRRARQGRRRAAAATRHAGGRSSSIARQLEPWEALCAELGERPADVALAWLLREPGRDRADHRPAHRWSSSTARCARSRSKLDDDVVAPARRDLPGPGGAAPEAYAW